jgi:hypothetical protein
MAASVTVKEHVAEEIWEYRRVWPSRDPGGEAWATLTIDAVGAE